MVKYFLFYLDCLTVEIKALRSFKMSLFAGVRDVISKKTGIFRIYEI